MRTGPRAECEGLGQRWKGQKCVAAGDGAKEGIGLMKSTLLKLCRVIARAGRGHRGRGVEEPDAVCSDICGGMGMKIIAAQVVVGTG